MSEHMAPPGFLVVQADHFVADRTFGVDWMQAPSASELYKFTKPNGEIAHDVLWLANDVLLLTLRIERRWNDARVGSVVI